MLQAGAQIAMQRVESALGEWLIGTWAPPALAGIVDWMWYFEGRMAHRRERVLPTGALELVLQLDEPFREVNPRSERYPQTCVTGQQQRPIVIEAPAAQRTCVIGIRFSAAGACAILDAPLDVLTDVTVDLRDIAADVTRLEDMCTAATGCEARLMRAAEWLACRAARGRTPDAAVSWACDAIHSAHGRISIADIQERTGWSKTRFTRTFREQVGITPKQLARITRFRRSLDLLNTGDDLSLIAHSCGYYDQPHFNADFRAFAGCTPSAYRAALRYPNSINLPDA